MTNHHGGHIIPGMASPDAGGELVKGRGAEGDEPALDELDDLRQSPPTPNNIARGPQS